MVHPVPTPQFIHKPSRRMSVQDVILYDICILIVFLTVVHKRQRTVIFIRRNNTDQRTHEIGSET